jgi:hypothetical protein
MTEWTLDRICRLTTNPTMLNALHACRPDHPWNKATELPWQNAWFLAMQQPSYVIPNDATGWLAEQATIERDLWENAQNEPPHPVDDGSCDPLYGQRMDSADCREC